VFCAHWPVVIWHSFSRHRALCCHHLFQTHQHARAGSTNPV
jgi:hypothetical protein